MFVRGTRRLTRLLLYCATLGSFPRSGPLAPQRRQWIRLLNYEIYTYVRIWLFFRGKKKGRNRWDRRHGRAKSVDGLERGAKDKQGKGEQGRAGERESRVLEAEKTRWQGLSKKFRIALTPFNLIRDAAERNSEIRACAREKRPRKGLLIERSTSEG